MKRHKKTSETVNNLQIMPKLRQRISIWLSWSIRYVRTVSTWILETIKLINDLIVTRSGIYSTEKSSLFQQTHFFHSNSISIHKLGQLWSHTAFKKKKDHTNKIHCGSSICLVYFEVVIETNQEKIWSILIYFCVQMLPADLIKNVLSLDVWDVYSAI